MNSKTAKESNLLLIYMKSKVRHRQKRFNLFNYLLFFLFFSTQLILSFWSDFSCNFRFARVQRERKQKKGGGRGRSTQNWLMIKAKRRRENKKKFQKKKPLVKLLEENT